MQNDINFLVIRQKNQYIRIMLQQIVNNNKKKYIAPARVKEKYIHEQMESMFNKGIWKQKYHTEASYRIN